MSLGHFPAFSFVDVVKDHVDRDATRFLRKITVIKEVSVVEQPHLCGCACTGRILL